MDPTTSELIAGSRLAVGGLIGLAVGLERQWSGHASGPHARFAGLRTFMMLGLVGGIAGLLLAVGGGLVSSALIAGGAALTVVAYFAAVRQEQTSMDGTTEAAALVVLALATLAGQGSLMVSSAAAAVVVFALSEKQLLHEWVRRIGRTELHAALEFIVLAVVILPLLPVGPLLGVLDVQPRALWTVVLIFSALNFASYIARKSLGAGRGYGVAGALGGLISSTAVSLGYARRSREAVDGNALARGVIAACTVLLPRILVLSATLNPSVAAEAAHFLFIPFLVGALVAGVFWRSTGIAANHEETPEKNPLRLLHAVEMALAFQVAISIIALIRPVVGNAGVYATASVLGLTDMDALTASMSRPAAGIGVNLAARALTVGVLANTLFKAGIAGVVGRGEFRWRTMTVLGAIALILALELLLT